MAEQGLVLGHVPHSVDPRPQEPWSPLARVGTAEKEEGQNEAPFPSPRSAIRGGWGSSRGPGESTLCFCSIPIPHSHREGTTSALNYKAGGHGDGLMGSSQASITLLGVAHSLPPH